jgi:HSP20 family protein
MSISRWEPFRDLMTLREAMDRLFEDSFVRPGTRWEPAAGESKCSLPVDAYVTDEEIVIMAAIPGVKPEDVDVTIEGDTLTIKGELPAPLKNVTYVAQERPYGKFQRTLRLNIPVQADKSELTVDKGVLTLVIPKREEIKPKAIKVNTK